MSWAAVVSGKARHDGPTTSIPPSAPPPEPMQFPSPVRSLSSHPVPSEKTQSPAQSRMRRPSQSDPNPPVENGIASPSPRRNSTQRKPVSNRRHKHSQHDSRSPIDASARVASHRQKHVVAQGHSIWDNPRNVAIYRLWTQHISSFMAQPVPFFHFFVMNPQFRQSVFDAGLTFYPDTDPKNPVLINLNSARFGMAKRISALSPPAGNEAHTTASRSPSDPLGAPPLPPPLSLNPSMPLQQLLSPHSDTMPFPSASLNGLFDGENPGEASSRNGEMVQLGLPFNGEELSKSLENMYGHDPNPLFLEDAFLRRFAEGARVDVSDSESERLSESDHSATNGLRTNRYPISTPKLSYDSNLPPSERRRAGRRRVIMRMVDMQIPSQPICKKLSDRAKAELVHQIEDWFPRITAPSEFADLKEDLLVRLRKIISGEWNGANIYVYGSAGNGLGLHSADVDMSLFVPKHIVATYDHEGEVPFSSKVILARLARIMEEGKMPVLSKVLEARVPVIKLLDPLSELQVDVCVNNNLAVRNTELLKAYVDLDERFRYVCILVKFWAKRRDLNDAYHGTLSSYAYTLLVIHYLQVLQPPVLPCLQQMVDGKHAVRGTKLPAEMTDNGTHKFYNTYYDRTVTPETYQSSNHTPVHELLLGFFRYYAYEFNYRTDLASIRLGSKASRTTRRWDEQSVYREWESKQALYRDALESAKAALESRKTMDAEMTRSRERRQSKGEPGENVVPEDYHGIRERIEFPRKPRLESKHLFCIEDPFDIDHDLSRGMEKQAVTVIRQEMMRAYELLAETGDFEEACQEYF